MENLPVNEKQPLFAHASASILQDKKETDDQNQNILQNILLSEPRSDKFLFLLLELAMPCCALMHSTVP